MLSLDNEFLREVIIFSFYSLDGLQEVIHLLILGLIFLANIRHLVIVFLVNGSVHGLLLNIGQFVVPSQLLPHVVLINVKQTKLEIINLTSFIKINLVKEESVVG